MDLRVPFSRLTTSVAVRSLSAVPPNHPFFRLILRTSAAPYREDRPSHSQVASRFPGRVARLSPSSFGHSPFAFLSNFLISFKAPYASTPQAGSSEPPNTHPTIS